MIFVGVEATLLYSLIKYRARRGGPEAEQIHGNTPLEIGWTVGAALILVVLTVVTFIYLPDIENPPPSGPNGLRAEQARFASIDQPAPPKSGRPDADDRRGRPAVPLALRLRGRRPALLATSRWWCRPTRPSC